MPLDLPGFYFDAERNRYFPVGSQRPIAPIVADLPTLPTPIQSLPIAPRRSFSSFGRNTASLPSFASRKRKARTVLQARFPSTQIGRPEHSNVDSPISAFCLGSTRQFLGDTSGWLWSRDFQPYQDDYELEAAAPWTGDICPAPKCEISTICTSQSRCVAVSFAPKTKVCIQDDPDRMSILTLSNVYDVRCASLEGSSLSLGAARNVAYLANLDHGNAVRNLATGSDVFSVASHEWLIWSGTRGGTVLRFDTRIATTKPASNIVTESTALWSSSGARSSAQQASTTTFIYPIHAGTSSGLVVGYMDGRLGMMDTRFLRPHSAPVITYLGHVGSVSTQLGAVVDTSGRFLFAAGGDCRLRAWALDNGEPVLADTNSRIQSLFSDSRRFSSPFVSLQLREDEDVLPVLWAAEKGGSIWRWRLGDHEPATSLAAGLIMVFHECNSILPTAASRRPGDWFESANDRGVRWKKDWRVYSGTLADTSRIESRRLVEHFT
ncbi:hypothetical protein MIND_00830400 [Mycena indigotica]|uniref:WD40 repeat-like protein n=1 Tax=Mycena indigotica TaxID=2126181 RepID=A0A8H6SFY0_9AGAR|nr:uncharacterized protein MIND_00830400 [Mycena indigotica]KAF7298828.1 hypothetical protein MIND_00830400 [Mycena indigotica]